MNGFILCVIATAIYFATLVPAASSQGDSPSLYLKIDTLDLKKVKQQNATFYEQKKSSSQQNALAEDLVIQFKKQISKDNKRDLENFGFKILQYLPENSFIVRGLYARALEFKKSRSDVYETSPYLSDWKLSEEFKKLSIMDYSQEEYIHVRILPRAKIEDIAQQLKSFKFHVLAYKNRDILIRSSKVKALDVASLQGIEFIQVSPQISTFVMDTSTENKKEEDLGETHTGFESGTRLMNFDMAWSRGFTGKEQIVAMADTGLDTGFISTLNKDLNAVLGGEAVGLFGDSWADTQGHGTHVAGSVIGQGVLSNGFIRGGAYDATFYAQGMWSPLLNNISVPFDLKGMFQNASNKGAHIHTNSWGSMVNLGSYDNYAASVDEFMFNNPDTLVLFSAGNNGQDLDKNGVVDLGSVSSPGTAKNVLTVGASENYMIEGGRLKKCGEMKDGANKWAAPPVSQDMLSDNPDGLACFSSRGPTLDGRIKPEIVAPGTNIVSLRSKHEKATRLWGIYNEHYSWSGGTSMATPLTAGAAAVTREYLIQCGNTKPSAALIKATLLHAATELFPGQFGIGQGQEIPTLRPNNVEGYGRVDMEFVTRLKETTQIIDEKEGVANAEVKTYPMDTLAQTWNVETSHGLRATLVYTDAPAAASSGKALVNNLDLEIVTPDGKKYTLKDSVNNSEMIEIKDGVAGVYLVSVQGANVPQGKNGKQPFALLVSILK